MTDKPKSILITGASSGIGEALAHVYAQPGQLLWLSGRNEARLQEVAKSLRAKGAQVIPRVLDVGDRNAMHNWITEANATRPLDLVIANAGVSGQVTSTEAKGRAENARSIFRVNWEGVLNTLDPAIQVMQENRRISEREDTDDNRYHPQIALMASLAGYRGMASAPAYSASKVAVKAYGEALRPSLRREGIRLSVICPGFVKSRITEQNKFKMPLILEADEAARIIKNGLEKDKGVIAFPAPMVFAAWLMSTFPQAMAEWISSKLPEKA